MIITTLPFLSLPFLAHIVRNRTSKIFQAVNTLKAQHRWCLTGTPIQNRLEDLSSLVEFLRVDPFDNPYVFKKTFLTPINHGDPSGWARLKNLIQSISLRHTKKSLESDIALPPRREVIHWVQLNVDERTVYNLVKRLFALSIDSGISVMNTFQFILRLRQICNHGRELLPRSLQQWLDEASSFKEAARPRAQTCEMCGTSLDDNIEPTKYFLKCFHLVCRPCLNMGNSSRDSGSLTCPLCDPNAAESATKANGMVIASKLVSTDYKPSTKVRALLQALQVDYEQAAANSLVPAKR